MGTGIIVCGLNGAGKSTLGRALAEASGFHFIDSEDLYFPGTDPDNPYANPRTRDEAEGLLLREIQAHGDFVFACVKWDGDLLSFFRYAVLLSVPRDVRLRRVWERSFRKFGARMLPGGDLYETEKRFLELAASREEDAVEAWAQSLACPVLRLDGTRPAAENIPLITARIQN